MSVASQADAAAWDAIETSLSWSKSFFVIYVLAPTPSQARALEARLRETVDPAALVTIIADRPGQLRRAARELQPLLEEHSRPASHYDKSIVWIDGSLEFEAEQGGVWRRAWIELIGRLNERRELMRESLRGLIMVAPPQAKRPLRTGGPDLWSIHAHVLELPRPLLDVPGAASPRPRARDRGAAAALRRALDGVDDDSARGLIERLKLSSRLALADGSIDALRGAEHIREAALARVSAADPTKDAALRAELVRAWLDQVAAGIELGARELPGDWLEQLDAMGEPGSSREQLLRIEGEVLAGELALATGDAAQAKRTLTSAQTKLHARGNADESPYELRIELGLARAHRELAALEDARQHYERALALQRSAPPLRELATLALAQGEAERAVTHLRAALPLSDSPATRVTVLRELAAAYMHGSHWSAARATLDQAQALAQPGSPLAADCSRDRACLDEAVGTRAAVPRTSLVILHLSDLHFGPHSRFGRARPQAVGDLFGAAIERHRIEAELGPVDLVVVSGDLSETADDEEFDAARRFCEALNGHLALGRERWAFVPGNHDLSWAHIELARVEQKIHKFDDEELERRTQDYKFRNYADFLDRFYADFDDDLHRVPLSPAGWVHDLPELGVSLGLLNSSAQGSDRDKAGKLGAMQAQALLDHWRVRNDAALRVIVIHHNPQPIDEAGRNAAVEWFKREATTRQLDPETIEHFVADTFGLAGTEKLERLARQAEVPLVLHGHVHATPRCNWEWSDGERRTHVLAAGSAGAAASQLPADQPNTVQLIAVELDDGAAQVLRLRYEPRAEEPGRIELGTFVREAEERGGLQQLRLALPERTRPETAQPEPSGEVDRFIKEYRVRLAGRFETWEFGTRQRGSRAAAVVTLDDMYVPLRLDAGYDQEEFTAGEPLAVDALLARERGLIVRGGPGAGKTTWMRWLFRRMVERADVLPIFVELRALARRWAEVAVDQPRSFEDYLGVWLAEWVGSGWGEPFFAALDRPSPRPVLLVDGWDELGDLGRELGPQLVAFAQARPHVLVVATSRPYGEGVSELALRFDELQLQPMSDEEVGRFVRNFYERVHRSEALSAGEQVDRFLANLAVNPQARSLGRTPLLLVMLLIIGRDRPLPDQRHELYRVCIEDLLDARPRQREALGALRGSGEWTPERYAERLQAAARLAWWMQSRHLSTPAWKRRDAVATRDELGAELGDWDPHQRDRFLNWLVNGAGLLIERDDGKLQFAHLGFQEYLAAWHLDATHDGAAARLECFLAHASNMDWWEVLRLFAALVEARSPGHLAEVAGGLLGETAGYWLVGAVLADGLGASVMPRWLEALGGHFEAGEYALGQACADAWKVCQQHRRREQIAAHLASEVPRWSWLQRWRAQLWAEAAGAGSLPGPPESSAAWWILDALEHGPTRSERHLAWGRVWMSSSPFWGGEATELLGLRLWPERRAWFGWLIQSAVGLGFGQDEVLRTPWHRFLSVEKFIDRPLAMEIAWDIARDTPKSMDVPTNIAMDIARDIAVYLASDIARDIPMDPGRGRARDIVRDIARDIPMPIPMSTARNIARNIARDIARDIPMYLGMDLLMDLGIDLGMDLGIDLLMDLPMSITTSVGYAGTRTVLAHAKPASPLASLLQTAARHSLDPRLGPFTPPPFTGHPMWPALARHIARCSTDADRELLEDLARNPEKAPTELLQWGLRYWVRGDVMFEDGQVLTLDEIWSALRTRFPEDAEQLGDLPYLDPMPSDIDRETLERALEKARR